MKDPGKLGCLWPTVSPRSPLSNRHSCYLPACYASGAFAGSMLPMHIPSRCLRDAELSLIFLSCCSFVKGALSKGLQKPCLSTPNDTHLGKIFARPVLLQ